MMGGLHDYLTAATYDDRNAVIDSFNLAAKRISPVLENFSSYKIDRVHYHINFDLRDFMEKYNPELIINLIKRGSTPAFFKSRRNITKRLTSQNYYCW
jgi:hypothetical protein